VLNSVKIVLTHNGLNIAPSVKGLDLQRIAWKIKNSSHNPELDEKHIEMAIEQYRKYLTLKIRYPTVNLVPTEDIDLIWHAHILDTENYASDCEKIFGRFLHHKPYFGEFSDESQDQMRNFYNETSDLWEIEFGEKLVQPKIYRCSGKACHAPTPCRCR